MTTLAWILALSAVLFAALMFSGRVQPSWAHNAQRFNCGDRCAALRERMWDWYHQSGAACVHRHEGSWHDPNSPYWGGFQFSYSFHGYGRGLEGGSYLRKWGTADHWPHFRQIHATYRGWKARGWSPWPNTARYCGLL